MLSLLLKEGRKTQIHVKGISMLPTLVDGDCITVQRFSSYDVGDILVFRYKFDELLVHRLLKKEDRYYCKGDNAFRLEDIQLGQILGKVVEVNGQAITPWPKWKIDLSLEVGYIFRHNHYDVLKTKRTTVYQQYYEKIFQENTSQVQ